MGRLQALTYILKLKCNSCRIYRYFKILLLVYKSVNDLGFENIKDILIEYKPSRDLKSEDVGQLAESRVHSKHGEAAFICYAAHK